MLEQHKQVKKAPIFIFLLIGFRYREMLIFLTLQEYVKFLPGISLILLTKYFCTIKNGYWQHYLKLLGIRNPHFTVSYSVFLVLYRSQIIKNKVLITWPLGHYGISQNLDIYKDNSCKYNTYWDTLMHVQIYSILYRSSFQSCKKVLFG